LRFGRIYLSRITQEDVLEDKNNKKAYSVNCYFTLAFKSHLSGLDHSNDFFQELCLCVLFFWWKASSLRRENGGGS
jgi:hypothetical protein